MSVRVDVILPTYERPHTIGFAMESVLALATCVVRPRHGLDPFFFAYDWSTPGTRFLRHWFRGAPNVVHRREVLEHVGYWREDLLRFFAHYGNALYPALSEPPQGRYLQDLSNPEFVRGLRARSAGGHRALPVRLRQWSDCLDFASQSGPGFLPFAWKQSRLSV